MNTGVAYDQLSEGIHKRIKHLLIPIASLEEEPKRACVIIKVKMRRHPASAGSETYEFKMKISENGALE